MTEPGLRSKGSRWELYINHLQLSGLFHSIYLTCEGFLNLRLFKAFHLGTAADLWKKTKKRGLCKK